MKLPFFNTNTNVSKLSEILKNDLSTQISNRLRNEFTSALGFVSIVYTFTSNHGRNGDRFATKLAKEGDNVTYFVNKDKKYQIAGRTEQLNTNEHDITQKLLAKAELGVKYNCTLTDWDILKGDKMHK